MHIMNYLHLHALCMVVAGKDTMSRHASFLPHIHSTVLCAAHLCVSLSQCKQTCPSSSRAKAFQPFGPSPMHFFISGHSDQLQVQKRSERQLRRDLSMARLAHATGRSTLQHPKYQLCPRSSVVCSGLDLSAFPCDKSTLYFCQVHVQQ